MLNVADFPERAALRHLLAEATVRAWLSDPAVRMRVADEHLRRRVHDVLKEEEEDRSVARNGSMITERTPQLPSSPNWARSHPHCPPRPSAASAPPLRPPPPQWKQL